MSGVSPEMSEVGPDTDAPDPGPRAVPRGAFPGVGSGVRSHRRAKGLSLRELARQLGVSASFISQLEDGTSQPSVATLAAICDTLAVTFDELFATHPAVVSEMEPVDIDVRREDDPARRHGLRLRAHR